MLIVYSPFGYNEFDGSGGGTNESLDIYHYAIHAHIHIQ